jgi:TrmH RNA methyltransferase
VSQRSSGRRHRAGRPNQKVRTKSPQPREVKVYGVHACFALFEARPQDIIRAYVSEQRKSDCAELLRFCASKRLAYHLVDDAELQKVSGSQHHEGICLLVREKPLRRFSSWLASQEHSAKLLLYLEGVENPHNVGAILRVAAHFGIEVIFISPQSELSLAGAASRVAEGGAESIEVVRLEDSKADFEKLRALGYQFVATVVNGGADLYKLKWPKRTVLLFGAEGEGLSRFARQSADYLVSIPGSGKVESLNVACAVTAALTSYRMRE